ncbi:MAG: efflux RND transporter permease subunit [Planctomycetota bacterium]
MDLVRLSINKPVGVTVGVLLLVLSGLIGLTFIPVQLTPTVDRPVITVTTNWPGRSPDEVVDQITKEQEERLKNVSNLESMRSTSRDGGNEITLEFYLGANIDRAMQEVSDRLRQVPEYPDEVDEPVIKAAEGASENAIAWIIVDVNPEWEGDPAQLEGFEIATVFDALDRDVKPYLERIDGIAEVNIFGGREREMQVRADPVALAQRMLTYQELADALRRTNRNTSAGAIVEGKRDYRVRVTGQYDDPRQILETIVAYRDGKPVYVRDVATVELGHEKARSFVRSIGHPAIAMNVIRRAGANVLDIMDELRLRLDVIEADILPNIDPQAGPALRMRQVYDETVYIDSAIGLVLQNLVIGGLIAAGVLLIFLRSFTSTGIIAIAIPVSVIGTFLVLLLMGRTLNVVSLAGLAFAVGMVVDNAIVVLENIFRYRQAGMAPIAAAYRGGREVWGAILASTLTTVAVFIPILTIQEEAGQLFRDIALAIVVSVTLSLFISITVIPAASSRWMRSGTKKKSAPVRAVQSLFGLAPVLEAFTRAVAGFIHWLITGWRGWTLRPALIIVLTLASVIGAMALRPPLDYLPKGNKNLVFGFLLIPPGYAIDHMQRIAERIEDPMKPYVDASLDDPASVAALDPIERFAPGAPVPPPPFDPVPIDNMFIAGFNGVMIAGATSEDPNKVIPVGTKLTSAMQQPDAYGGAQQTSIFQSGIDGGSTINIEISGPRLDRVNDAAGMMFGTSGQLFGFGNLRADPPNFNLSQPEFRLEVNDRGRELGLTAADVGSSVRALFDGLFIGDYELDGEKIDLVIVPDQGRLDYKERLASVPVSTPLGRTVPLDSVINFTDVRSPQQIARIEELPSVTIRVTPPQDVPLEQVMAQIRSEIIEPAEQAGLIDDTMRVRLEGTAAKLDDVRAALFGAAGTPTEEGGHDILRSSGLALALAVGAMGLFGMALCAYRGVKRKQAMFLYGAIGAMLLASVLAGLFLGVAFNPGLLLARFVWALLVTYLLMAALFESFVYPFVIMFTVPLAVVGGFAGLAWVHAASLADPTTQPQQLDVLTMLGFVVLIGVVVNNAILLVHQALNFMRGDEDDPVSGGQPLPPARAIAESVRTRIRPIFMSTMTSVGGMLPLVLAPGAGSEMYRGLGSVVVGGLLVSTFFTLLLAPLLLSLTLQMTEWLRKALGASDSGPVSGGPKIKQPTPPARELQPA